MDNRTDGSTPLSTSKNGVVQYGQGPLRRRVLISAVEVVQGGVRQVAQRREQNPLRDRR